MQDFYSLTNCEDASIGSLFSHSLTFEDCVTVVNCSTTLSEMGNCTIQYGRDPSYQDLGPPISGSLNSSFPLPLMESSTLYYIQITFMMNSELVIFLRRNYKTGNSKYHSSVEVPLPPSHIMQWGRKQICLGVG